VLLHILLFGVDQAVRTLCDYGLAEVDKSSEKKIEVGEGWAVASIGCLFHTKAKVEWAKTGLFRRRPA
jgi:hypothetical protein